MTEIKDKTKLTEVWVFENQNFGIRKSDEHKKC